ncbi:MAG: hypothetical protein GC171_13170 [Terrimonas sp.]|nr:hypothetical protein [Terrimonas sp.]
MQLVILANNDQREAITASLSPEEKEISWIDTPEAFLHYRQAHAFIDLLFENTGERIKILAGLLPQPVFINAVTDCLDSIHPSFIRINGWEGFLSNRIVEAAALDDSRRSAAAAIWDQLNKKIVWCPDLPGFISARVIAMIINEAYWALEEGVATKEDMDIAMKTGTNYPFGPFEWGRKIGLLNIYTLLQTMSKGHEKYRPCPLLKTEAQIT